MLLAKRPPTGHQREEPPAPVVIERARSPLGLRDRFRWGVQAPEAAAARGSRCHGPEAVARPLRIFTALPCVRLRGSLRVRLPERPPKLIVPTVRLLGAAGWRRVDCLQPMLAAEVHTLRRRSRRVVRQSVPEAHHAKGGRGLSLEQSEFSHKFILIDAVDCLLQSNECQQTSSKASYQC